MRILGTVASSSREVPNAPTIGTATDIGTSRTYTPQNGGATVTFTAPAWTGGLPILDYTATSSPGGFTATGAGSPLTVNGLAPSTSYTFTVTARNSVGSGAASAASNSITATTVPQAPTIGTATATGGTTATVAFTANATGGKTITSYTATSSPGGITASGATSPITVTGLTSGTAYTFTVTATNANGVSGASAASNSVTPAVPGFISQLGRTGTTMGGVGTYSTISVASNGDIVTTTTGLTTFKVNSSGTLQWQKQIGTGFSAKSFVQDSSGNVYIGGIGGPSNTGSIMKLNSSGVTQWVYYSSNTNVGSMTKIFIDSSGNIIGSGEVPTTYRGAYVAKFDSNGTNLWSRDWSGSRSNSKNGLGAPDSSGNIYWWANNSSAPDTSNPFLTKLDSSGTTLWQIQWGSNGIADEVKELFVDSSGNAYCSYLAGADVMILKFNSSGTLQWQRRINGNPTADLIRFAVDGSGNLYGLAMVNTGIYYYVFKWNSSGTLQWQRVWTSTPNLFLEGNWAGGAIAITGTDYVISFGAYNGSSTGGAGIIKAPLDGSKTGTYSVNGIPYTYAASSFFEGAGLAVQGSGASFTPGQTTTTMTTLTGTTNTASTYTSDVLAI